MTRRRALLIVLLLGAATCALAACEKQPTPPVPTPGARIDSPRIVALSPALGVILRDLGLEQRIVGRHAWDLCLPESLPICGDQAGIDYEALLRARPTHVVIQWGARERPARLTELAASHHWTIVPLDPLSLDQIAAAARTLEREFDAWIDAGHKGEHGAAARLERALGSPDPALARAGRVLLLTSADPATALGPGSFHADALSRLGALPALREGGAYQRLEAEDVLRLAPDGIVLIQPRGARTTPAKPRNRTADFDAPDLRMRLGKLAELNIPAVRSGCVALIDDPLSLTPSTAMISVAERLRAVLLAWGARDGNPGGAEAPGTEGMGIK